MASWKRCRSPFPAREQCPGKIVVFKISVSKQSILMIFACNISESESNTLSLKIYRSWLLIMLVNILMLCFYLTFNQLICFLNFTFIIAKHCFTFTARSSYASAVLGIVILLVRLSVSPSVTRLLCDETKEHTADISIPHDVAITLVFWYHQRLVSDVPST